MVDCVRQASEMFLKKRLIEHAPNGISGETNQPAVIRSNKHSLPMTGHDVNSSLWQNLFTKIIANFAMIKWEIVM